MWNRRALGSPEPLQPVDADSAPELSRVSLTLGELRALLASATPEYELSAPFTFGGPPNAGPFSINIPYAGECEAALLTFTNTTASSQVFCVISPDSGLSGTLLASAAMTTTLDGSQPWRFMAYVASTTSSITPALTWFPLQGGGKLYLYSGSSAAQGVYVTVQFRRRLNPAGVPHVGYP